MANYLNLKDFHIGKNVDKGFMNTTHHCGRTYQYFNIPEDREEDVHKKIINAYSVKKSPLYLNEHATRNFKLHLDIDLVNGNDVMILPFMEKLQRLCSRNTISDEKIPFYFIDGFIDLSAVPELAQRDIAITLRSEKFVNSELRYTYHVIWPYLIVDKKMALTIVNFLQKHIGEEFAPFIDTGQIQRGSLRAFLCDKWEREIQRPAGRPFVFHQLWDGRGRPMYGDEDNSILEKVFTVCAKASSIRWFGGDDTLASFNGDILAEQIHFARRASIQRVGEISGNLWLSSSNEILDPEYLDELCNNREQKTIIQYINKFYAKVDEAKNPLLIQRINKGEYWTITRKTIDAFKLDLMPFSIIEESDDGDEHQRKKKKRKIITPLSKLWLTSIDRLVFKRIVMDPYDEDPKCLNLWPRFLSNLNRFDDFIGASYMDWDLERVLNFIDMALCNGEMEVYDYTIKWLAHLAQRPETKIGTSLVFVGPEGTGKDIIFCSLLKTLFGPHFLRTSDVQDLVGRFNSQIEGKIACVYDEADNILGNSASKMKALITDELTRIEFKGVDLYYAQNFLNFIICTNKIDEKFIEVGPSSRRYHNFFLFLFSLIYIYRM